MKEIIDLLRYSSPDSFLTKETEKIITNCITPADDVDGFTGVELLSVLFSVSRRKDREQLLDKVERLYPKAQFELRGKTITYVFYRAMRETGAVTETVMQLMKRWYPAEYTRLQYSIATQKMYADVLSGVIPTHPVAAS